MEKHENIYVETSAVVLPSTIAKAIEVDEKRVLFGSDYPYLNIRVELTKIEEACEKEKYLLKTKETTTQIIFCHIC